MHIYKIRDVSGQYKVMHRNLLLDMSFLPVPSWDPLASQSLENSSDAGGDLSISGEMDGLRSLEKESSQARTSIWVLSDSDHNVERDTVAEKPVSQLTD